MAPYATITDIKLANTILLTHRTACDGFAEWAKAEATRLRTEAQEMILRAEGIEEAAMVLRLKLNPTQRT